MKSSNSKYYCLFLTLILLASCSQHKTDMVIIPAGKFIMGSTLEEREYGYQLDENRGSKDWGQPWSFTRRN